MMKAFLVFTIAAVGTYVIRISGIVLLGGDRVLPPRVKKALSLVAPAAMAAIVANSLFLDQGEWREFGAWHVAALIAVGIALWRRSMGWTLAVGAVAFALALLAGW